MSVEEMRSRLRDADVIFVAQDGVKLAPARIRCYSFAKILREGGMRAEVLSFFDHLGAADQGGPVDGLPVEEKLRLNLQAFDLLSVNPKAVLYTQKAGYHALSCLMAAARRGNPLILDYDDYDLDSSPFRDLESTLTAFSPRSFLGAVAGRAKACVASSRRTYELVRPHNPNTHLVHTVADQDLFTVSGRESPRTTLGDAVNVLWCGDVWGHAPMRDIFFAVDAFSLVPPEVRRRARFHIIGFGRAWEETKNRLRSRHGCSDNLVTHDFVPPDQMPAVFRETDIGVLPYADIPFNQAKSPTKMFEYMLSGVSILATPVGEVTHCLEDGRSVRLATGLRAFAEGLTRLIDDRRHREDIASRARERALAEYSLQGVRSRLAAIIEEARAMDAPNMGGRGPVAGGKDDGDEEVFMARRLGRRLPIAAREVALARQDLETLTSARDLDAVDPRCWSAPLLALLEWQSAGPAGPGAERIALLRETAARARPANRFRSLLPQAGAEGRREAPGLCKFADAGDWEDPEWFRWLDAFKRGMSTFPVVDMEQGEAVDPVGYQDRAGQIYNFFKRSAGGWEKAHLSYGLDRLGVLGPEADILVICGNPNGFYMFLSLLTRRVDVLGISEETVDVVVGEDERHPWTHKSRACRSERLSFHHGRRGMEELDGGRWDAIVALSDVWDGDAETAARLARWIADRIAPGGIGAAAAWTRLGAGRPFPPGGWSAWEGCEAVDAFDDAVDDATLDRFVQVGERRPHFVREESGMVRLPAAWFMRRIGQDD